MVDILIRRIDPAIKLKLQRRAARRGRSLEADLREAISKLAETEPAAPDENVLFGDWLVAATRPGFDLEKNLRKLRAGRGRKLPQFK